MFESTSSIPASETSSIGDTMSSAMRAVGQGAVDARGAALQFLPMARQAFVSGIRTSGFCIGYGVTLPACFVARLVPRNNPLSYGMIDGALAGLELAKDTTAPKVVQPYTVVPAIEMA